MIQLKHKKGDVNKDGFVFCQYDARYPNGEHWVTKEQAERNKLSNQKSQANRKKKLKVAFLNHPRTFKRGQLRSDGMIFYQYNINSKGFEHWVTTEWYNKRKAELRGWHKDNFLNNPLYRLSCRIRGLVSKSLSDGGYSKTSKTYKILGCSYESFYQHIESNFTNGMSWDNMKKWEIDHKIPVSAGRNKDEIIKLNHYTNLQPMWAKDNKLKSNKYCPKQLNNFLSR